MCRADDDDWLARAAAKKKKYYSGPAVEDGSGVAEAVDPDPGTFGTGGKFYGKKVYSGGDTSPVDPPPIKDPFPVRDTSTVPIKDPSRFSGDGSISPGLTDLARDRIQDNQTAGFKAKPIPLDVSPDSAGGPAGRNTNTAADAPSSGPTSHQSNLDGQAPGGPPNANGDRPGQAGQGVTAAFEYNNRDLTPVPGANQNNPNAGRPPQAIASNTPGPGGDPAAVPGAIAPGPNGQTLVGNGGGGAVIANGGTVFTSTNGGLIPSSTPGTDVLTGGGGARAIYQLLRTDVATGNLSEPEAVQLSTRAAADPAVQRMEAASGGSGSTGYVPGVDGVFLSASGGVAAAGGGSTGTAVPTGTPQAETDLSGLINTIVANAGAPAPESGPTNSKNAEVTSAAYNAAPLPAGLTVPEMPAVPFLGRANPVLGESVPPPVAPPVTLTAAAPADSANPAGEPGPSVSKTLVSPVIAGVVPELPPSGGPGPVVMGPGPAAQMAPASSPAGGNPVTAVLQPPPPVPHAHGGQGVERGITARGPHGGPHPSAQTTEERGFAPRSYHRPARAGNPGPRGRGIRDGLRGLARAPRHLVHLLQSGSGRRLPSGGNSGWWLSLAILALLGAGKLPVVKSGLSMRWSMPTLPRLVAGGAVAGLGILSLVSLLESLAPDRPADRASVVASASAVEAPSTVVINLGQRRGEKNAGPAVASATESPSIASRVQLAQEDGVRTDDAAQGRALVSPFSVADETVVVSAAPAAKDPRAEQRLKDFVRRLVAAWTSHRAPAEAGAQLGAGLPPPRVIIARLPAVAASAPTVRPAGLPPATPAESEAGFLPSEEVFRGMGWGMAAFLGLVLWRARRAVRRT